MVGKIKLIVAIEDEIYLDRLCDYLETVHGRFTTERYSDKEILSRALSSQFTCDAIIFEEGMLDASSQKGINKIKILLSDRENITLIDDCYSTKEYKRMDEIASSILSICSADKRFMGIETQAANSSTLYVFTSPVGGSGKSTISLASAIHLARSGKQVLYINLEQVPSVYAFLPPSSINMTQITRMALEKNPKLLTAVEGGKATEPLSGLEYFSGFGDITDFDSLKPEHLKNLASNLCSLGRYDVIIADVAWNMVLTNPLFEIAEKIFLIARNTNLSVSKINSYLQYSNDKEMTYRNRLYVILNSLNGSPNSSLIVNPIAAIPMFQMMIDTSDFASTVLHGGGFSDALEELVHQF